jgi:hypothetical protein
MGTIQSAVERYLFTPVDVLAEAQISQFNYPKLDPWAVSEPGSLALAEDKRLPSRDPNRRRTPLGSGSRLEPVSLRSFSYAIHAAILRSPSLPPAAGRSGT